MRPKIDKPRNIEFYKHHGKQVAVFSELKGKHWDYCLCGDCRFFNVDDRDSNCPISNALYEFDRLTDLVTPVWECPEFKEH